MVKNALIVPVGSKGGFVVKRPPAEQRSRGVSAGGHRLLPDVPARAARPHRQLRRRRRSCRPERVVRYDGDDPYLVVAADKGTARVLRHRQRGRRRSTGSGSATRSPPAARTATTTRRWGSPPAAPGNRSSATSASSASTSPSQDFTVVGIGDMSGDVFGNGMLRSRAHPADRRVQPRATSSSTPIPTPTPASPSARRLFDLPRSAWSDYDPEAICEGGGVHSRTAKSIEITSAGAGGPRDRGRRGSHRPSSSPRFCARPVDLLFNGGIGTYVKAAERDPRGGRRPRQRRVRVDGRAAALPRGGEGGNLGLTQRGRIEYALRGGPTAAAGGSTPTRSTTSPASTAPTTRSTSRSCSGT